MLRFELDENLGIRGKQLFQNAGWEADTVADEDIKGIDDEALFSTVIREKRCLLTLDIDFTDRRKFNVKNGYGIIIFRTKSRNTPQSLTDLIETALLKLKEESPIGKLWIVEPGRIKQVS